ncbi:beta-galactosidase [Paenibacillus turpanensis]|uniref:beta-galactosidase n=1 Tax=Paenibacillus turpanensis TaxID=2689078 RepID=UPI00140D4572|nr:beta-galactosidase [Paenibacillus turpanensis]
MSVLEINVNVANKEISPGKMARNHGTNPNGRSFGFTSFYMTRDHAPVIPVVGEFHFSRFSHLYWEEELLKMKAGGVSIAATYVFWNHHEEDEGRFRWDGDRNLRHFIDLCSKHELPLILRIGPFCHGEVRNGGLPDWLFDKPLEVRSNDERYLCYVERLYREIARQLGGGSLYQEGGPIIGIQLENEFMHCGAPLDAWGYAPGVYLTSGTGGNEHLNELRRIAEGAGLRPLFFTATAWGGAAVMESDTLPMLAGYAYTPWIPNQPPSGEYIFRNLHTLPAEPVNYNTKEYPVAYCEMAGGMQVSYKARPYVAPESIEAMTLVKLASGSNLLGYYMYHGGTNPVGKRGFLNESGLPKLTYDYQAPLGEFGRVGGSYDRIRSIAMFLEAFGTMLAPMGTYLPEGQDRIEPSDPDPLRWCVRQQDGAGFVFINNFQDHVEMRKHEGVRIELQTSRGPVSFPQKGTFTLKQGASVILPFHLERDGVHYKSTTVQPLTTLRRRNAPVHVFIAHEGLAPELVIAKDSVALIEAEGAVIKSDDHAWVVQPSVGKEHGITLHAADGRSVQVLVLSRVEALQAYRFDLWGEEQLVLSEANLYVKDERLICTSTGRSDFSLWLLGDSSATYELNAGEYEQRPIGAFHELTISCPHYEPQMKVEHPSRRFALIDVSTDWPTYIEDVFLEISYEGDVAGAYLGDRLITDHIQYGAPWFIGLKQFRQELRDQQLLLSITPLRKGEVHAFVNQAYVERFEGVEIAQFQSIHATAYYRTAIRKGQEG